MMERADFTLFDNNQQSNSEVMCIEYQDPIDHIVMPSPISCDGTQITTFDFIIVILQSRGDLWSQL